MKKIIYMLALVAMTAACNMKINEKKQTPDPLAGVSPNQKGVFAEVTEEQMATVGLTPEDYQRPFLAENALETRAAKAPERSLESFVVYPNGTIEKSLLNFKLEENTANVVKYSVKGNSRIGDLNLENEGEISTKKDPSTGMIFNLSSIGRVLGSTSIETLDQVEKSLSKCRISNATSSSSELRYGNYTLENGTKIVRAIKKVTREEGNILCAAQGQIEQNMGRGVIETESIRSNVIPNINDSTNSGDGLTTQNLALLLERTTVALKQDNKIIFVGKTEVIK